MTPEESNAMAFIELAIRVGALKFGSFKLKSERMSPYFLDTGSFNTGESLALLSSLYANSIEKQAKEKQFDVIYGHAYKGISLACSTAVNLYFIHEISIPWCHNRKEPKDHGEMGDLVGHKLFGRVLIVDDVITKGTAKEEAIAFIRDHGAEPVKILIMLDRQEIGTGSTSAVQDIKQKYGIDVISIATFSDIINYLISYTRMHAELDAMLEYQEKYGVK